MQRPKLTTRRNISIILAVLIIALTSAGVFVYSRVSNRSSNSPSESKSSKKQATPPKTSSTMKQGVDTVPPNQDSPNSTNNQITLDISALGLKIINIPDSLKDLKYVVNAHNSDPTGWTSVWFSTASLASQDPKCSADVGSLGVLEKVAGTYDTNQRVGLVKQYNGFWIAHESPQAPCSENKDVQGLTMTQIKSFDDLVSNSDNIQLLDN